MVGKTRTIKTLILLGAQFLRCQAVLSEDAGDEIKVSMKFNCLFCLLIFAIAILLTDVGVSAQVPNRLILIPNDCSNEIFFPDCIEFEESGMGLHGLSVTRKTFHLREGSFVSDSYEVKGPKGTDTIESRQEFRAEVIRALSAELLDSIGDTSFDGGDQVELCKLSAESIRRKFGSEYTIKQADSSRASSKFLHSPIYQSPLTIIKLLDGKNNRSIEVTAGLLNLPIQVSFNNRVWQTYSLNLRRSLVLFKMRYIFNRDADGEIWQEKFKQRWEGPINRFWSYLGRRKIRVSRK